MSDNHVNDSSDSSFHCRKSKQLLASAPVFDAWDVHKLFHIPTPKYLTSVIVNSHWTP